MIVAGVGFRRDTSVDEIEQIVRAALDAFGVAPEDLGVLATESEKAKAPAFVAAASRLSVAAVGCAVSELGGVADRVLTPSRLVMATKGVPSIAEASALVVAGRNARLLGARVASAGATCSIAIGDGR